MGHLEQGRVTDTPAYRKQHQAQGEPQDHTQHQAHLTHSGPLGGHEGDGYPSYLSMATVPTSRAGQQQTQEENPEDSETARTESLLRSRKAVLPSEMCRKERSTEDPWRGRTETELCTRTLSRSQADADDFTGGGHKGREHDRAIYIHKGVTTTHIQPRATHAEPGIPTSTVDTKDPRVLSWRNLQNQAHDPKKGQQDSRVSVVQLRHSYMESTNCTTSPISQWNEL